MSYLGTCFFFLFFFYACLRFLPITVTTKGYFTEAEMVAEQRQPGTARRLDFAVVFKQLSKDSGIFDDIVYDIRPKTRNTLAGSVWYTRTVIRPNTGKPEEYLPPRKFLLSTLKVQNIAHKFSCRLQNQTHLET